MKRNNDDDDVRYNKLLGVEKLLLGYCQITICSRNFCSIKKDEKNFLIVASNLLIDLTIMLYGKSISFTA